MPSLCRPHSPISANPLDTPGVLIISRSLIAPSACICSAHLKYGTVAQSKLYNSIPIGYACMDGYQHMGQRADSRSDPRGLVLIGHNSVTSRPTRLKLVLIDSPCLVLQISHALDASSDVDQNPRQKALFVRACNPLRFFEDNNVIHILPVNRDVGLLRVPLPRPPPLVS